MLGPVAQHLVYVLWETVQTSNSTPQFYDGVFFFFFFFFFFLGGGGGGGTKVSDCVYLGIILALGDFFVF